MTVVAIAISCVDRVSSPIEVGRVFETHVVQPAKAVDGRIRLDVTLEVDVLTFSNVLRVQ